MKLEITLLICLFGALTIYRSYNPLATSRCNDSSSNIAFNPKNEKRVPRTETGHSDYLAHLEVCRKPNLQSPSSKYHGVSLISSSTDSIDLVLCPGDSFGDLNGTYITVEDCNLAMFYKGNFIWSSNKLPKDDENMLYAISLQRDGNLVVYKESMTFFSKAPKRPVKWPMWDSKTHFHPNQTELRIHDQQLQIIQTFQDGNERAFYTGEGIREFREDLGAPRQVAERFLMKSHSDIDNVILRRNECIGDLNGLHLILQTNCELQLMDKKKPLWSFAAYFKHGENCTFNIQEDNSIGISGIPGAGYRYEGKPILPYYDFTVLQSNITFQGDRLLITQTLKNGSEVIFYTEPGQDNLLKLKRELRQVAPNNITISSKITLKIMNYIGDLDGLHLVLQDNCHLKLMYGQQDLWKLQQNINEPLLDCFVDFNEDGIIMFNSFKNTHTQIFGKKLHQRGEPPTQFQLLFENDMMIMILHYQNSLPEVYHAGPNTNGTWFQFLSADSLTINSNENQNLIIPEKNYIGDLNGVYVILDKKANLILYNKTEVIWESRTTQEHALDYAIVLTKDGDLAIAFDSKWTNTPELYFWCTQTSKAYKEAKLKTSELFVNNDGLWLINSYVNGVVMKFKALEGTDTFALVQNENEPSPQIYKL